MRVKNCDGEQGMNDSQALRLRSVRKNSLHPSCSLDKEIAGVLLKLVQGLGCWLTVGQCKGVSGSVAIGGSVIFEEKFDQSCSREEELIGEA